MLVLVNTETFIFISSYNTAKMAERSEDTRAAGSMQSIVNGLKSCVAPDMRDNGKMLTVSVMNQCMGQEKGLWSQVYKN